MKTCVVIPVYNEARTIASVVEHVRQQNLEAVVVDDGSCDNTCFLAEASGARVLKNQFNQGKGAALRRGFHYALENDFDAVITLDGDGQHLPSEIPRFIRQAEVSLSAVIIGNRMSKHRNMPLLRLYTNKIMSWIISGVARQNIPDTQCGFRMLKKEALQKLNLRTQKYDTESEILIEAARLGFKIESLPIKAVYRKERSHINPFIDTLRFLRLILRESWTTRH